VNFLEDLGMLSYRHDICQILFADISENWYIRKYALFRKRGIRFVFFHSSC